MTRSPQFRALVSTGVTGAAVPEFFEGNKAKKKIFMELEKYIFRKKKFALVFSKS